MKSRIRDDKTFPWGKYNQPWVATLLMEKFLVKNNIILLGKRLLFHGMEVVQIPTRIPET